MFKEVSQQGDGWAGVYCCTEEATVNTQEHQLLVLELKIPALSYTAASLELKDRFSLSLSRRPIL
jgi:hypothetical protein